MDLDRCSQQVICTFRRGTGDVDVAAPGAAFVPGVGDLDGAEAAGGLRVVGVDAEVEDAQRVPQWGALEADQGLAGLGRHAIEGDVPTRAALRPIIFAISLKVFPSSKETCIVQPSRASRATEMGAAADANDVAGRLDGEGGAAADGMVSLMRTWPWSRAMPLSSGWKSTMVSCLPFF